MWTLFAIAVLVSAAFAVAAWYQQYRSNQLNT
jgi:hypothetical protein